MIKSDCKFCNELGHKSLRITSWPEWYRSFLRENENILFKNEYISLMLDFYPIKTGHVLIVPNRHIYSFNQASSTEIKNLDRLQKIINEYLNNMGIKAEYFEHGNGDEIQGASVSHAHIHCIPNDKNILDFLKMKMVNLDNNTERTKLLEKGYLHIRDINGNDWYNYETPIISQYMKHVYSESLGIPFKNWKESNHDNTSVLRETRELYSNLKIDI